MLLVAHGSRNPGAESSCATLTDAVRRELADRAVAVAYLDFTAPSVGEALRELVADGVREVVVVPLLFAPGYHLRVDLPAAVAEVAGRPSGADRGRRSGAGSAPVADEPDRLLEALESRLTAAVGVSDAPGGSDEPDGYDALVLASAGSSDPAARTAIEGTRRPAGPSGAAGRCSRRTQLAVAQRFPKRVAELRSRGFQRVAVASLFLAPGRLPEMVRRTAVESGAVARGGLDRSRCRAWSRWFVRRQEEGSAVSGHGRSFPSFV